jgi:malate dehydrogenase (oxaloacetate-decarboxylating)
MVEPPRDTSIRGFALLHDPILNRGTAFTEAERRALGLDGLLPPAVQTIEQQAERVGEALESLANDLDRHFFLRELQDRNETLFHRVLVDNLEQLLPIVYTPTVGLACERYSHVYRRNRGLFLSYPLRDRLAEVLRNRPYEQVDVIVATDGERILGLGDQGAGGLGISIGKLALYTAVGGVPPERTLPILLDVGTNNADRLDDPQYVGWRHERVGGEEYFEFVERFVAAVETELPGTLLQWEDFATPHARPLLTRYRDRLLSFNDDIQGTAAVAVGALTAATRITGVRWRDQRIVILGAGSAAIGVADMIRDAILRDGGDPRGGLLLVDIRGLVAEGRHDLTAEQSVHAAPPGAVPGDGGLPDLAAVVRHVHPTALIGLSSAAGAFGEEIMREMAARVERPVVMPLSNPTRRSEAAPADIVRWTGGAALVATGSPFPPVELDGRRINVPQCNNVFVFPGVGQGVVASGASRVSDPMLGAAARALGDVTSQQLLPPVGDLRSVAAKVACAVGVAAVESGVAPELSGEAIERRVAAGQWWPAYR